MSYVPLDGASDRDALLALARAQWDQIAADRPDLAPAVDLQRALIARLIDSSGTLMSTRLPKLSLPPRYLAAKLGRGVPALHGEPIPIPSPVLKPVAIDLCRHLAGGGAGEAADHIREALEQNRLDVGSLLTASLARNQQALRAGAVHMGLAPDLLWLVAELAASPFVHALQRALLAGPNAADALAAALAAWDRGYCPACGSWPALAEVALGHRVLRCSFCAAGWERHSYCCIYCGEAGEAFVTAAPDEERKDRRLELCTACGGYLKTIDVWRLSPFPLLAIADLETMDLDMAAMGRGFARPPLPEIGLQATGSGLQPGRTPEA